MRKKERYEKILAWFRANRPIAETELHYDNPFELLIAVILSAQCTDTVSYTHLTLPTKLEV